MLYYFIKKKTTAGAKRVGETLIETIERNNMFNIERFRGRCYYE